MRTFVVDAFTNEPFQGNQAGVCFIEHSFDVQSLMSIARELGFSETAFLQETEESSTWLIRFFSPVMEIPLCGHATIAAAAVLFEELETTTLNFVNVEGLRIPIRRWDDDIAIEFPVYETAPASVPQRLFEALGLKMARNSRYNEETNILMVEIGEAGVLGRLEPDFYALKASHDSINGVLVTAKSRDDQSDYHYRYFWPWSGTNEDAATGGVQTFLAPYWAKKLRKRHLRSFQSSERTGSMQMTVQDDTVIIRSNARIMLEGEMRL